MADTKQRILDAATDLFAMHGFDGVSVRDIIGRAHTNLGSVTYHFGSKEALFGDVLRAKVEPLRRKGEQIARSGLPPDGKLRALMEEYALHVLHEEPALRVLFSEMLLGGARLPEAAVEGIRLRNALFSKVVREGIRAGIFRRCDVECAAWNFFGMLSAYILYEPFRMPGRRQSAYSREAVLRIVRTAMDVFLNGLRSRSPARRAGRLRGAKA